MAVCQEFRIENEIIPKIASHFAGGIGNTGSVCGAVVGATMAIGLVKEQGNNPEERLRSLQVAQEFRRRFEAELSTINCRELTGADLTTIEGIERFMSSDIPRKICFPAVRAAYRIVLEMLKEDR